VQFDHCLYTINDNELTIIVNDGLVLECVMHIVVEVCFDVD